MNPAAPAITNLINALTPNREPTDDETRAALVEGLAMVTDFLDDVRRIAVAAENMTCERIEAEPAPTN